MLQAWEPSFWQRAGVAVGQALDQAIKGDYAEETTLVGTAAQIGVSFIPVADTITDIRDLTYSAQQFWYKPSLGNAGWVAVDLIGFIPVLGSLKPVFKGTVKYYAQIRLQIWQNSVCTGQGNLPLITQ